MADPWLGEIKLVPCDFVPRSYAVCDGALMSIAQHTALFSLLGTTYGGDGRATFALPDLRGRLPTSRVNPPEVSAASQPPTQHVLTWAAADSGQGARSSTPPAHRVLASSTTWRPSPLHASAAIGGPGPSLSPSATLHFVIALTGELPGRS